MQKVLIGTPCYDGKVDVWFANSLLNTIKMSYDKGINVHAIYTSYDSLVQRARNSLFRLALEGDYDYLFFIDSDVEWEAEWFFRLLERPEPIVGAALIKKTEKEEYTVKIVDKTLKWSEDQKIIEVEGVGTGFLKISKFALLKLWEMGEKYQSQGVEERMVFDIKVENGDLISEDYILCNKWKSLGYKVWLDPTITINHIGIKKFKGDISAHLKNNDYV
jgi:hypothetical protein